jgi:pyridoxine 4-dehydrogenase
VNADATSHAASASFRIGGEIAVSRLGYGAMRISGPGIWGPPADPEEARAVLRRLPELGVDFIDTADCYGPFVSESFIGEELAPYAGLTIATKAGLSRPEPDPWIEDCRPDRLRRCLEESLVRLRVDVLDLWQLHRIDAKVPRDEQFGVLREARDAGLVRHVGLSEVSVEEIEAARRIVEVATVQNRYNVLDRAAQAVLEYCEAEGIGFIPWYPLGEGAVLRSDGPIGEVAARHEATPAQVALAWLLDVSPVVLPIPGTASVRHLEENMGARALRLSVEDRILLDGVAGADVAAPA